MGRPKGSKNKVKSPLEITETRELIVQAGTVPLDMIVMKPKRKPKAAPTVMDKLAKARITQADLEALKVALGIAPVAEDKAALRKAMMNAPLSPAEIAKLKKEAYANQAKVKDPQIIVQEAVNQVVVPNWPTAPYDSAGLKHFLVKTIRNGDSVSFDKEKWDLALKVAGIKGAFHTCKPEGSAEVDPQAKQGGGNMTIWRVMIG